MNKSTNILLFLFSLPILAFTLAISFDMPLEIIKISGANLPYQKELFWSFAAIVFMLGARRSIRRWMGLRMVNQVTRFRWNKTMSLGRYRQSNLYLILEGVLHLIMAYGFWTLTERSYPVVLAFSILGLDHLVFALLSSSKRWFRVGLTGKAIVVADRQVTAIYLQGLKAVSVQQESIFFDYGNDLQLDFPVSCIEQEDRQSFREELEQVVNRNKVHFSDSFKSF
ncbi:MAG: hypothetical protein EP338_04295 [Bacteroidetes bacterium]|nr:MAG: hypothetical protein EP338_04295 [Bacteroidota bacterium]